MSERHRRNALEALERMIAVAKDAHSEIKHKKKFYYWEPKLLELTNLVQALRLSGEMLYRDRANHE